MKNKILLSLLVLVISFTLTGCGKNKKIEEDTDFSSITTYLVLTSENSDKDIMDGSQITYQDDLSDIIISIYNSKDITEQIYKKYGFKIIPMVKSINEKNTKYETKLSCGNLSNEECIEIHKKYDLELIEKLENTYQLFIKGIDNYSISK